MHSSKDEKNNTELSTQRLKNSGHFLNLAFYLKKESHETDVDQIESHHKKVIHAIRHFGISMEAIDEEHPPISVKGFCHPNGHWNGN
jgi:hypothetical protein